MKVTLDGSSGAAQVPVRAGDIMLTTLMDVADARRLGNLCLSLGSHGYAQMFWEGHVTLVHRWILGLKRGDKRVGDHINGDPLDNRRANLRAVTASGSSQNVSGRGRSKYRGVVWNHGWAIRVKFQGADYTAGGFKTEEDAALAADQLRRGLMPEYAGLRVKDDGERPRDKRSHRERMERREIARAVREWAHAAGLNVSDRGRLPTEIIEAYNRDKGRAA